MAHSRFTHLRENMLAAVDLETTGLEAGYHEIIQVAVVPLDSELKSSKDHKPFYLNVKPDNPDRASSIALRVSGLDLDELGLYGVDQGKAAELFREWFENLSLPSNGKLVPLAHNWVFEAGFLRYWLGYEEFQDIFFGHARDSMLLAIALNDASYLQGEKAPFYKVSLKEVCKLLHVKNERPHDALHDALAGAECYQKLLELTGTL